VHRGNDREGNHAAAVDLLRLVDASLATTLKRALDRKTQAAYESADVGRADPDSCVRWAQRLVAAAETRLGF
jgi:hypothetical protein